MMKRRSYLATLGIVALTGSVNAELRRLPSEEDDPESDEDDPEPDEDEDVLNIKEYGAVGDGEADDRDAIQDAINDADDGDTIYLPEPSAHYRITRRPEAIGTIVVDGKQHADYLTIIGDGPNTVVKMEDDPGGNYGMLQLKSPADHTLRIRNFVLDGNKENVDDVFPSFCLLARDTEASGTGDIRIENLELRRSIGHGAGIQYGGVRLNRCTAIENGRHGFVFATGYTRQHDPRPILEHSLSKNNNDEPGYYCVDCTSGKAHVRDTVMVGGSHGTKTSEGAIHYTVERCRIEDCSGSPHRSTGEDEQTTVEFGDVIAARCDGHFRLGNPEKYIVFDGTELVVTECGRNNRTQIYLTDTATLDASNAAVYSNRAKSAVGFDSDTSAPGSTVDNYYFYENDNGPTKSLKNVTTALMAKQDKTDIRNVPKESDVGAWSAPDVFGVPLR